MVRILAGKPIAYWRLGEIEGDQAFDESGNGNHGTYERGYACCLDGPQRDDLLSSGEKPRAVQFVGGCMKAQIDVGSDYTVELFFFNGNEKNECISGGPVIEPKTWNRVRLVRRSEQVAVYLNDATQPILSGRISVTRPDGCKDLFVGGRSDSFANLEGRMAEVAVFRI